MTVAPEPLDSRDRIAGLKKGLHIIEAIDAAHPRLSATERGERCGMTVFKSLAGPCKTSLQNDQFSPRRRFHHWVWLTTVNTTAAKMTAERGVVKNSVTNNHPSLLVAIMAWR
jgi:hypothetical protein